MTNMGRPVEDIRTDYDILDPEFVKNPHESYSEIRESDCPIAHSDRWGGSWLPTKYEDIVAITQETGLFLSSGFLVVPPTESQNIGEFSRIFAPPISSDPPDHQWHRRLILPMLSNEAILKYEQPIRDLCNELIDKVINKGTADVAEDYAQHISIHVMALMLGMPLEMKETFTGWIRGLLEHGMTDPVIRAESRISIIKFFIEQLHDRKNNPRKDDLITSLLNSKPEGRNVDDSYVLGVCNLMLIAGVDTTWAAIGSCMWHLAQHPEHRNQLRDKPELWGTGVEELLRVYAPVTMARIVDRDTEFKGCPMKSGDRVLIAFPAANRDPSKFENPNTVILDRNPNRHLAFGSGIHRCAGSHLARLELRIALQTWLERIPNFELMNPAEVVWSGGQVHGPRRCMVKF
jgi:cytochrome P450